MTLAFAKEIRIKLYVTDFDLRKEFYENIIKWPIREEWSEPGKRGVMFDTGAGVLELLENQATSSDNGDADLSIEVVDVRKLWEELKHYEGIVFSLRENPWGDTSFCIRDTGGFCLTFFSRHT